MRQFGVSRVTFRELANNGLIPGVKSQLVNRILIDCRFDRKSEENHNRKLIHMYTDPIADYLTRVRNAGCKPQGC
jgi:hypothetical protein